jgi:hypothetical protein
LRGFTETVDYEKVRKKKEIKKIRSTRIMEKDKTLKE